jgi:uncharacterized OsmC-like protein
MVKISAQYLGEKRVQLIHAPSGRELQTDAPRDNNGRGESFSPTDLVAAGLASCALTVMAIAAEKEGLSLEGASAEVTKHMAAQPRRISRLDLLIRLPHHLTTADRQRLEVIARTCPVAESLPAKLELNMLFAD